MPINRNLLSSLHRLSVRSRHLLRFSLLTIFMGVLVVACQGSPEQNLASQSPATETGNCRLVEHEAGETEICGQPETVAALSPRVLDPMLALGVQPAAYAESTELLGLDRFDNPSQQIPTLGDRITTQPVNLGDRITPSLETLVEVNPDLILGETSYHNYEIFSKIAPTLLLDNEVGKDGWSRRLQIIAQAFGKEERAEQVIAEYEQQLAETREKLAPVVAAYPRVLTVGDWNNQNTFRILSSSLYRDHIAVLLEEIGFEMVLPDSLQGEAPSILGSADISIETLIQLDPDIIIVSAGRKDNFYNPEPIVKQEWEENPLLQKMRAVQEGRICFVSAERLGNTIGGPIAYKSILDLLPDLLLPFVEGK